MLSFNILVKKLSKESWKILFKEDIFEIIDPEKKPKYQSFIDKAIYKMKIQKKIIPLKSGIYIIPEPGDELLNEVDLIEKYYLKLLKKYITFFVGSEYYISWKKSLQFHLKDFSIPEKISVVNRKINKRVKVGSYEIIFKTISGKQDDKKINLYTKLIDCIVDIKIEWFIFKVSSLELSLVESAIIGVWEVGVDIDLLTRALKKYSKVLKRDTLKWLAQHRFIMAFNRLKELSKSIDDDLYHFFLDTVKENGWLFIGEGLRGF